MKKFRNCQKLLLNRSRPLTWQKSSSFARNVLLPKNLDCFRQITALIKSLLKNWDLYPSVALDSIYSTNFYICILLRSSGPELSMQMLWQKLLHRQQKLAIFSFPENKSLDRKLCTILFYLGGCLLGRIINCINFGKSSTSDLSRHFLKGPETQFYDKWEGDGDR